MPSNAPRCSGNGALSFRAEASRGGRLPSGFPRRFPPTDRAELGGGFAVTDARPGDKPKQYATAQMSSQRATIQINDLRLAHGINRADGRQGSLEFPLRRHGATRRRFIVCFLTLDWGRLYADYADGIAEGVRRFRHIGSITGAKHAVRRESLTAVGSGSGAKSAWQCHKSPRMESHDGNWTRRISPKWKKMRGKWIPRILR